MDTDLALAERSWSTNYRKTERMVAALEGCTS